MELGTTFKWNLMEIMGDFGTQLVSLYLNNLGHRIIAFSSVAHAPSGSATIFSTF